MATLRRSSLTCHWYKLGIHATGTVTSRHCGHRYQSFCRQPRKPILIGRNDAHTRRTLFTDSLPAVLVPPSVFLTLLITLWTYKCFMTVLFQDKIIYMPYMPPFARSERLEDYAESCKPVEWTHHSIRSLDGTRLSLCVGSLLRPANAGKRTVICYFHGNGASLPPRLPMLSNVLKAVSNRTSREIILVGLSYRGYWTSGGRANEQGIRQDARATLAWIRDTYSGADVVVWGQSLGAGVACSVAHQDVKAVILETPFTSIKSMLIALYPQKWLPYQYLWPFLWNHWDNLKALQSVSDPKPPVLLLVAKRDEVVPREEAGKIESCLRKHDYDTTRVDIFGSLHTEATTRREGQQAIAQFLATKLNKN